MCEEGAGVQSPLFYYSFLRKLDFYNLFIL